MSILLEEHNPSWSLEFLRVRNDLLNTLKDIPITSIEHVGSTSIPNLISEPVLDIDIIVPYPHISTVTSALESIGYVSIGEYGIANRWAFRQPGFVSNAKDGRDRIRDDDGRDEMRRNVYVVLEGCIAVRNHLDIKRVLLEDSELRGEYGRAKKRIVEEGVESTKEYYGRKTEVLVRILRKAGWGEENIEEVRKANE